MNGSPDTMVDNQIKLQMNYGKDKVDDDKIISASSSSSSSSSRRGSLTGKLGGKRVFQWEYDPSDLIKVFNFTIFYQFHLNFFSPCFLLHFF